MIAGLLNNELIASIAKGGTEPEIVRAYAESVGKVLAGPDARIRATFIHQRPYAMFVQPQTIVGRSRCELGDILYVFKKLDSRERVIAARAALVQVKKGVETWEIDAHP